MLALVRYVAACCLATQRWVAPTVVFAVSLAVTYVAGGGALTTLAEGATWLFPITAWVTVVTVNDEDDSQAAITAAAAGGPGRARIAKLVAAAAVGAVMTVISLLLAIATDAASFTLDDLGAGVTAHLLAVTGGVAFGSLCARPIIARTGWAVLAVAVLTVVDLVVPDAPPVRVVLAALTADQPQRLWLTLLQGAGEVAAIAVLLVGLSARLSRNRT